MTILMAFFGLVVFCVSCVTAGFKTAFKRFAGFVFAGAIIDLIIVAIAFTVTQVN